MNSRNRKAPQTGKSRTSSKEQTPKQTYEIVGGNVIVTCPRGHKNQAQKVSDKSVQQHLVCANTTCKAEWDVLLPQIMGLEEA